MIDENMELTVAEDPKSDPENLLAMEWITDRAAKTGRWGDFGGIDQLKPSLRKKIIEIQALLDKSCKPEARINRSIPVCKSAVDQDTDETAVRNN